MNIILTGVTGTLGSRILYELWIEKRELITAIYLLVRPKSSNNIQSRVENILQSEFAPEYIKHNWPALRKLIHILNPDEFLVPENFLVPTAKNYIIHAAGFVNLSTDPSSKDEIFEENYEFTKTIFEKYQKYISKFIYISTAFSIGNQEGLIQNDYLKIDKPNHRNFYEASKHAAEKFLSHQGKEKGIPIQVLRPSVLGGNIMDTPNFFISKYMVFYLFAKFFYNTTSTAPIRIVAGKLTGLNIIPVDYAAKVISKVFDTDIEQLNITHSKGTAIMSGMSKILEAVGFKNFSFIESFSNDDVQNLEATNELEQFFYNTIGIHLHPYLTSLPYEFDTTLLESILPIPKYNLEEYLFNTVSYAKSKNFKSERW